MNCRNIIPILTALLLTSCATVENTGVDTNTTAVTTLQTTTSAVTTTIATTTEPAEATPATLKINEEASLAEQVADALYFLATTEGNELYDGYYSSISLIDVNFDGIPEIKLYDSAGSAANFVYLYSLNGTKVGEYGIPSMDTSFDCIEKDGRKLFMMTGKSLNFHPQNGEDGPTDYHFVSIYDFDSSEEHKFRSTIIYEDETLEKILSATVRTDDIEIEDTATVDEIEMYYNEFMKGYTVIGAVDSVSLQLIGDDLSSKESILEKITAKVQEFEALGKE
ncbi:MAG: hypothetical protein J6A05_04185 [Oscillospiraceae bacterium]|nr:hypothetical protein [Oscillospiraceae bacterium]